MIKNKFKNNKLLTKIIKLIKARRKVFASLQENHKKNLLPSILKNKKKINQIENTKENLTKKMFPNQKENQKDHL